MVRSNDRSSQPLALPRPLRLLIIGGILGMIALASLIVGRAAAEGETMLLIALLLPPLGLVAAMIAVRYFELLVLILPLTALAMRFAELPTGTASPLPISLMLTLGLLGIWLATMYLRRTWDVPAVPFNRSLFIFMAICCISLPWGIIWRDPILEMWRMGNFPVTQVASLLSLLASMGAPLLIGRFIDSAAKIKFYLGSFLVCGGLMTFVPLLEIEQPFLNANGLWGLWSVAALFGVMATLPGVRLRWRILCGLLIGLNLYLTVVRNSLWLSGWVPSIIGLVAIIFLHSRKAFFVVCLAGALFVTLGPGREFIDRVTQDNVEEGGLGRLEIWERNLGLVAQHWLLGTGPAGYAPYNMTYFRFDARSTHNNYMDILAQFGVLGLLTWCWFMGASLWFGWRTINRAPPGLLRTTAMIATGGWAGALASMMFGDWILPFAYNQGIGGYSYTVYSWIFLGLLVSVHRLLEGQPEARETLQRQ